MENGMEWAYLLDPGDLRAAPQAGEIANYRVRTIRAGDQIEVEAYPIHKRASKSRKRRKEAAGCTTEAQKKVNARNEEKKIRRLLNENFGAGDIHMTLTYAVLPETLEAAQKCLSNAIRRLRRLFEKLKREGKTKDDEFKYLYVTEDTTSDGRPIRLHHHIVLNVPDRDAAEACWDKGRANADRLQPDRYGLIALAKYLTKSVRHHRRWACSRNLRPPRVTVADRKLSRRRAEQIGQGVDQAAYEIFTKLYPGCEYLGCTVKYSEWFAGAYITAQLRSPPEKERKKRGKYGK